MTFSLIFQCCHQPQLGCWRVVFCNFRKELNEAPWHSLATGDDKEGDAWAESPSKDAVILSCRRKE